MNGASERAKFIAPALLDTDTLSEVIKQKNDNVVSHAVAYLDQHGQFVFSALTRYEVLRGLLDRNAGVQLAQSEAFCLKSQILPLDDAVLNQAARLW